MRRSTVHSYTARTKGEYERIDNKKPEDFSPRMRLAFRLYVHGVVPTQKAAAEAAGLHPQSFHMAVNTPAGQSYMKTAHEMIEEHANNTNALIQSLSVRAIQVLGGLMEDSGKDEVRLRAAQDLADRGTDTAKIHKHQVESFSIASGDARAIAEAMVMAASVRSQNAALKTENFDRVNVDEEEATEVVIEEPLPSAPAQLTLLPD